MPAAIRHFNAIFKARTMEFVRDRGTFIWNLVFPVILVLGFAFAIPGGDGTLFKVGSVGTIPSSGAYQDVEKDTGLQFIPYSDDTKAVEKLRRHQLDLVVDWDSKTFWINQESSKSGFVKKWFLDRGLSQAGTADFAGSASAENSFAQQAVSGKAIRYVDWLIPGVIAMNMMFSSLFGVGFVLVRYRKNGVLKRLKATPVSSLTFVSAQAVSRLVIVTFTAVLVYMISNLFLGFRMEGNYFLLLLVFMLGALCVIGMGLLFATRLKSEELVNGLLNLLTFPMILLSGVFYSLEGAPEILSWIAQALPLTHVIDASRAIMLDGAGILQILPNLGYLGITTMVFFGISGWLFKWE